MARHKKNEIQPKSQSDSASRPALCDNTLAILLEEFRSVKASEELAFAAKVGQAEKDVKRQLNLYTTIASVIFGAISTIVGVSVVLGWPQAKNEIMSSIGERYVNNAIEKQLNNVKSQLAAMESHLATLKKQGDLMRLRISAMSGSRSAYDALLDQLIQQTDDESRTLIASIIDEIKEPYSRKPGQLYIARGLEPQFAKGRIKAFGLENCLRAIQKEDDVKQMDDVILWMKCSREPMFVSVLMKEIEHGQNLHLVNVAIEAVGALANEDFPALGTTECLEWWARNKNDSRYVLDKRKYEQIDSSTPEAIGKEEYHLMKSEAQSK